MPVIVGTTTLASSSSPDRPHASGRSASGNGSSSNSSRSGSETNSGVVAESRTWSGTKLVEAVDDPMYALDTDWCFTFLNDAAKREFGYGEAIIGERDPIGMESADFERNRDRSRNASHG
ncbi:hypothetical protein C9J85_18970 [Haloferax sp. wsp5]|nr:hypothetical protein C9J85_18970 [Haloferax sp. wsp5]